MSELGEEIRSRMEARRTAHMEAMLKQAGGNGTRALSALLRARSASSIAKLLPERTTVREFAEGSLGVDLNEASARVEQCARCPVEGGACDSPYEHIAPGLEVFWSDDGLDHRYCGKWAEYQLRKNIEAIGVPKDLSGKRFRNFEATTPSIADAKRYAVMFTKSFGIGDMPRGLLLVGTPGSGKTHLAVATLVALIVTAKVKTASFRYVPKFLSDIRDSLDEPLEVRRALTTRACDCDLLVLDDLGAERTTEWVREQLGIIVNERWANGRSTIVTSNDDLGRFASTLGPRTVSRLESMLMTVPLEGPDHRAET
jgi:DNA replication protein DnaC